MSHETIWSNSDWHGAHHYTIFVALNDKPRMLRMVITWVLLFLFLVLATQVQVCTCELVHLKS